MDSSSTRSFDNGVLISPDHPPLKLKLDPCFTFVGRLQIVLYNIAEADIFVFADADSTHKLNRWIIVQFEGFLNNNTHTYNYNTPSRITLGSHEYMFDDYVANISALKAAEPDSDGAHVINLILQKGYLLPDETIRVRFMRTLDATRRKELLIIYGEDLQPLGFTSAELSTDGPLPEEHSALAQPLHDRALSTFTILSD